MQEQYKFVYDTLEEFVLCGYSYFPVKEISQRLRQKSQRKPGCKLNEYQKDYMVRRGVNLTFVTGNEVAAVIVGGDAAVATVEFAPSFVRTTRCR